MVNNKALKVEEQVVGAKTSTFEKTYIETYLDKPKPYSATINSNLKQNPTNFLSQTRNQLTQIQETITNPPTHMQRHSYKNVFIVTNLDIAQLSVYKEEMHTWLRNLMKRTIKKNLNIRRKIV